METKSCASAFCNKGVPLAEAVVAERNRAVSRRRFSLLCGCNHLSSHPLALVIFGTIFVVGEGVAVACWLRRKFPLSHEES